MSPFDTDSGPKPDDVDSTDSTPLSEITQEAAQAHFLAIGAEASVNGQMQRNIERLKLLGENVGHPILIRIHDDDFPYDPDKVQYQSLYVLPVPISSGDGAYKYIGFYSGGTVALTGTMMSTGMVFLSQIVEKSAGVGRYDPPIEKSSPTFPLGIAEVNGQLEVRLESNQATPHFNRHNIVTEVSDDEIKKALRLAILEAKKISDQRISLAHKAQGRAASLGPIIDDMFAGSELGLAPSDEPAANNITML